MNIVEKQKSLNKYSASQLENLKKNVYSFALMYSIDTGKCRNCGIVCPKNSFCIQDVKDNNNRLTCVNCRLCPSDHYLNYRYDLRVHHAGTYAHNQYVCDLCSKEITLNGRVLSCPECEFDVCNDCEDLHFGLPKF